MIFCIPTFFGAVDKFYWKRDWSFEAITANYNGTHITITKQSTNMLLTYLPSYRMGLYSPTFNKLMQAVFAIRYDGYKTFWYMKNPWQYSKNHTRLWLRIFSSLTFFVSITPMFLYSPGNFFKCKFSKMCGLWRFFCFVFLVIYTGTCLSYHSDVVIGGRDSPNAMLTIVCIQKPKKLYFR